MKNEPLSRRALLLTLGGLGAVAATGKAFAMSHQTVGANSELGIAYANRCTNQTDSAHAQLLGDLQSLLMQRSGASGEVLIQTAYCPICGCPVTATRTVQ